MPKDKQPPATPGRPGNILVVLPKLVVGGMERHLLQVLPALCARGFDVEVFPLRGPGPLDGEMSGAGVPVVPVRPPLQNGGRVSGRLNALAGATALRRHISRRSPRLVHFFLPEAYLLGGLLGGIGRVPAKVMSRRSLNHYQDKHPISRRGEACLHRRMDGVLGNSEAVLRDLAGEGVAEARLGLIYNGVSIECFADRDATSARQALNLATETLVLAIVANLIPYKGHADLLEALARAKAKLPADWCLLIAGRDDGIGAALRAQGERLGLGAHLRWLDVVSDVGQVFAASDIVCQPSHEEGLPNAVLEAMAAGRPVVASRVGGLPEIIESEVEGLLVPARDPDALADALVDLATNPGRRRALGQAGRIRAQETFALETCVERYARLYAGLLQGDRQPLATLLAAPQPERAAP